jgi:hypothetical protein
MSKVIDKKLLVVVDGVTYYGKKDRVTIDGSTESIEDWEAMEANGFTAKCYRPGITTWTVSVIGKVVYHGTDMPARTETEDSITFTFAPPALTPDDTQEVEVVPSARN